MRDKLSKDLNAAFDKIDALITKLESLGEFVSLNVVPSTPVPAASPVPPNTNNAPVPSQTEFQVVRNNVSPKRKIIPMTKCQNHFQILSDTIDDDEEEVRLVGDSMVRGQLIESCARASTTRRRFCIPGGGVQDVFDSVNEVADQAPTNTTYVIHVGTNDIQRIRTEELLDKY